VFRDKIELPFEPVCKSLDQSSEASLFRNKARAGATLKERANINTRDENEEEQKSISFAERSMNCGSRMNVVGSNWFSATLVMAQPTP